MPIDGSTSGPDSTTTGSLRRPSIEAGASIEVRARFDGRWCGGFEVVDKIDADAPDVKYRVRRTSDGAILPVLFTDDDITSARAPAATE
jgi:hypothetical protein